MLSTIVFYGARGRNRTGMPVLWAADFKSAVSTDFTTRARAFEDIDLQCNKTKTDKNPNTGHPISLKKQWQCALKGLPEMEI